MTQIGIIGFGRFGKLMTRYLSHDFPIFVYNYKDRSDEIIKAGGKPVSIEKVCAQDIIIFGVPISGLKQVLKKTANIINKDALVLDVCAVKETPIDWMNTILNDSISILGTHPMFGPDSAAKSLEGQKIVLCKERIETNLYEKIKDYLSSKGLIVIETSAKIHDQQIAVSLGLTQFIGRSLEEFGAVNQEIDTQGYKRLLHILGVVGHDTWQLFEDLHNYNRYCAQTRKAFIKSMNRIDKKLKS